MSWGNKIRANVATRHTNQPSQPDSVLKGYAYVTEVLVETGDAEKEGTIKVKFANETTELVYPINYHVRHVPVKGELVPIYDKGFIGRLFYGPPVNIHNYPTHNSPSSLVESTSDYKESIKTNPYKLFSGDVLFEGRFGQSIRFSQTLPNRNSWSQGSEQGNSAIIISSGQPETADTTALLSEDLNKDSAVLVLLENGKLKYDGATDYEGNQALLVSDRVHIKAREENVDITAKESLNLQDSKWNSNLTEILDLIEMLIQGGNIVPGSSVTGVNAEALQKLLSIKRRVANGN